MASAYSQSVGAAAEGGIECGPAVGQLHEEDRRSVHSHAHSQSSRRVSGTIGMDALQQQLAELAAREAALMEEDADEEEGPSDADLAAQVLAAVEGEEEAEINNVTAAQAASLPASVRASISHAPPLVSSSKDPPPPASARASHSYAPPPASSSKDPPPTASETAERSSELDHVVSSKVQDALQAIAKAEEAEGHAAVTVSSTRVASARGTSASLDRMHSAAGTLASGRQAIGRPVSARPPPPDAAGYGTPTRPHISRPSTRPSAALGPPALPDGGGTPTRSQCVSRSGEGDGGAASSSGRGAAARRPSDGGASSMMNSLRHSSTGRAFNGRAFDEEDPHQVLKESLVVLGEIEMLIRDSLDLTAQDAPLSAQDPAVMERIPPELLDALEETVGVIIDSRSEISRSLQSTPNNSRPSSAMSSPAGGYYRQSSHQQQHRPMSSTSSRGSRGGTWGTPPPPNNSASQQARRAASASSSPMNTIQRNRNYIRDAPLPEWLEEQQRRKAAAERKRVQQVQKDLQLIQKLRNKQEEAMQKHAEVVQEAEESVNQLRSHGTKSAAYNKWLEYQETMTHRAKIAREKEVFNK